MEEKYSIIFSKKALYDLKMIHNYISIKLKEPQIAQNYTNKLVKQINILEYNPQWFNTINERANRTDDIRILILRKNLVFFKVYKIKKQVKILRILNCNTNWIKIFRKYK